MRHPHKQTTELLAAQGQDRTSDPGRAPSDSQCCPPAAIDEVRTRGDSCGGVVTCVVRGCPKGLGMPVFGKLEAELAGAVMSLPASKVSNSTASGSLPHCDPQRGRLDRLLCVGRPPGANCCALASSDVSPEQVLPCCWSDEVPWQVVVVICSMS